MCTQKLLWAVLASLCLLFPYPTMAQKSIEKQVRDTLTLQLGGKSRVIIPVENVRNLDNIPSINSMVRRLNQDLSAVYDSLIDPKYTTTVIYLETPGSGRTLKVNNKTTERLELYFTKETGQVVHRLNADSVIVALEKGQKLLFVLDSLAVLQQLERQDIDALVPEASREITASLAKRATKDLFPYKGPYRAYYNPNAEIDKRIQMDTHGSASSRDYLALNANMGAGLIRDKLVPELGFEAAFVFGNRRFVGFNTTLHYFFDRRDDGKYGMAINTFLNIEYAQTFNRGKLWQKIGIGYLVGRQGNYFGERTFKASLSLGTRKFEGVHLIPELIVTDNFRTAFPSLRVGIGF